MDRKRPTNPSGGPGAESAGVTWVASVAAWLLRALGSTWRIRVVGGDPFARASSEPVLGALLHRDFLIAAWMYRDRGFHVGVSRSRDGDLVDTVLARLGYGESGRGSSSRGGLTAQRELMDLLEHGASVAVVVDGPRGPAGEPKPGVAQLAAHTGVAIQPVTFETPTLWRFGSWDRAGLPLPFARIECRYGEPLDAARDADLETVTAALKTRLG